MKKIFLFLALSCLFLLSACAKKIPLDASFGNYSFIIKTYTPYQILDDEIRNIGLTRDTENVFLGQMGTIIHGVKEDTMSGFVDSLLVYNFRFEELVDLNLFVERNLKSVWENMPEYTLGEIQQESMVCGSGDIAGRLVSFDANYANMTLYFAQYFFINGRDGYLISFVSDDEDQRSLILDGLEDLSCK